MFKIYDAGQHSMSTDYRTTTPVGAKDCEVIVKNMLMVFQWVIFSFLNFMSLVSVVVRCKQRCKSDVDTATM